MSVIPNNMGRRAASVNVLCQQLFNCTKNFDCSVSGVAYWCELLNILGRKRSNPRIHSASEFILSSLRRHVMGHVITVKMVAAPFGKSQIPLR